MSDENDNTDNTDGPTKAELHDRVRKLESTVEKLMPSRRDALKLGAAGIAGAAGLSATTQTADASTGSAGDIGDPNNRPDVFADTVDANQLSGVSSGGIKTKTRAFLSSNSSADPIPLDSVSYDPDNNFDTTANEYTVPADGTYLIAFQVRSNSSNNSGARLTVGVKANGTKLVDTELITENQFATVSATDIRELATGDTITLGNVKARFLSSGPENTFLSISRLE